MLEEVLNQIGRRSRFVLTSHARPDGDAIGSVLACSQILRSMGKQADVYLYDGVPQIYRPLPFSDSVVQTPRIPDDYEAAIKGVEEVANADGGQKIGSMFTSSAKSFLTSAKQLMRRVRDKVPYSSGDKMMLNAGSGWMIEGSPERLLRDYNQLIESYNRGARI